MGIFDNLKKGVSSESDLTYVDATSVERRNETVRHGEYDNGYIQRKLDALNAKRKSEKDWSDTVDTAFSKGIIQQNQTLSTPGSNPYGVERKPWIFTTFNNVVGLDKEGKGPDQVGNLDTEAGASTGVGVTDAAKQKADKGKDSADSIVWYANPKSVDWSINQRGSETKTKGGTVLHMWRDRARRTDYDDPKITMTFQSGNIMPVPASAINPVENGKNVMPPGLNDFYKFLELVDRSKISKGGQANLVHILYRSRIFPAMVISGFFEPQSVVRFSDSADNPYQVNSWSATFTIYKTVPAINNWAKLAQQFKTEYGV